MIYLQYDIISVIVILLVGNVNGSNHFDFLDSLHGKRKKKNKLNPTLHAFKPLSNAGI